MNDKSLDENANIKSSKEFKQISIEDIKDLSLFDNDFFLYAIDNNKELADVLINPALNYLGINNYQIVSVKAEVYYGNLKNHSIRIDCKIKLESGEYILIEIQNGHSEEMPLKRIRYQHGSLDTKVLNQGESYDNLANIISLIYTTDPLPNHDTGDTLNDFAFVDLKNNEIASDYGVRVLVVNAKYKNTNFKEFSDVIEDLQKTNANDIKNPVIKNIHLQTKQTEKGRTMYSEYFRKNYGDVFEELQKEKELRKKATEELVKEKKLREKDQEEIQRYKQLLNQNGIAY